MTLMPLAQCTYYSSLDIRRVCWAQGMCLEEVLQTEVQKATPEKLIYVSMFA